MYAAVGSYPITQTVTATDGTAAKSTRRRTSTSEPGTGERAHALQPDGGRSESHQPVLHAADYAEFRAGPQVSRASGLPIYEGGVAPSNTPGLSPGAISLTSKFQSLAVALRDMAEGGGRPHAVGECVASAASMHVQTLPQSVQAQQSRPALLTSIETQLKALNASLSIGRVAVLGD